MAALRSAEQQTFTADGIQGVALRYGLIYGDDPATRTLVALLRQGRLALPTDGGGIMSWIYLDDAVVATVAALERGRPGQAYNLVDDEPVRWRDFLGALARAVEAPPPADHARLAVPPRALHRGDADQHPARLQRQGQD